MRIYVNIHEKCPCIFARICIIFCEFVYWVINIDLVCGSAGYFVFVRIQTISLRSTCVLSLSSLKSVSELLISIYFHTRVNTISDLVFAKKTICAAHGRRVRGYVDNHYENVEVDKIRVGGEGLRSNFQLRSGRGVLCQL